MMGIRWYLSDGFTWKRVERRVGTGQEQLYPPQTHTASKHFINLFCSSHIFLVEFVYLEHTHKLNSRHLLVDPKQVDSDCCLQAVSKAQDSAIPYRTD